MRLYDPDSGEILISGRSVASIPPAELHTKFGVVFQHDFLMADTIANNISFGRGLSMEQIKAACERAQAREFIEGLPGQYAYMLTAKGTNLSGGQKQRLLVAPALWRDPLKFSFWTTRPALWITGPIPCSAGLSASIFRIRQPSSSHSASVPYGMRIIFWCLRTGRRWAMAHTGSSWKPAVCTGKSAYHRWEAMSLPAKFTTDQKPKDRRKVLRAPLVLSLPAQVDDAGCLCPVRVQ